MTIVVPTNGRPSVYYWTPVETTNGVEYLEDSGRAVFLGRHGVLGTVGGFGHFKGRCDTPEGWTATLSGTLRHDGHCGLFAVTRRLQFRRSTHRDKGVSPRRSVRGCWSPSCSGRPT